MPQLDFITFFLQIALMFFLSWNIQSFIMKKILPSNIHYNINRKYLWEQMSSFIIKYKFISVLFFLHIICSFTEVVKKIILILNTSNLFIGSFSRTVLMISLKSLSKLARKKNFFVNINFYNRIFLLKLSNYKYINLLNVLILEKFNYSYIYNYLTNLALKLKKKNKVMVKELRYSYLQNQIVCIKDLLTIHTFRNISPISRYLKKNFF